MKKLNLEEMENVQGGIKCADIIDVLEYLYVNGHNEQYLIDSYLYLTGQIQCN